MEDRFGSGSAPGPLLVNPRSDPKPLVGKRDCTQLGENSELARKRIKIRGLESVFRSEASLINEIHYSEPSMRRETMDQLHLDKQKESSRITEQPATTILDVSQTIRMGGNKPSLLEDATCLSLGNTHIAPNPLDLNAKAQSVNNSVHGKTLVYTNHIRKPSLIEKHQTDCDLNFMTSNSKGTELDLNAQDASSSVVQDPFFHLKLLDHVKSREASECGSSTGPLEENDSLRMWKEMKKNGFMSSSHGGIPMPKQRGRKGKNDVLKKKMELAKREQVNRFTKIAAPSGLLNGLNPGIINHVRNSKQVHSIIEALVRSEKLENGHLQSRSASHIKGVAKEIYDRKKNLENVQDAGNSQLNRSHENEPPKTSLECTYAPISLNRPSFPFSLDHKVGSTDSDIVERKVHGASSDASNFTSEHEDNTLIVKLSSATAVALEDNNSVSNNESANQASVCLSVKAATVASQWLELLYQDIKGRLAGALVGSSQRNAIAL
uniref:Uncharacterized protein n=1 Tax=Nelumbo nucifera TaxID=4432 RepID=A0A822ZAS5_NELNU|nr:TPA_asm: hypothetical protein HUJ06_012940 [Nelumbo nucifera]